jgi:enoyl-CoA hydratase
MDWRNILFEKEAQVAFITLNRPEVYNALNHALLTELGEVIEQIKRDSDLGAVILTGAGDKAFVSGADINELSAMDSSISGFDTSREHQSVLNQLER